MRPEIKARLGRENRLKKSDFDLVFERGRRVRSDYFDLLVLSKQNSPRKLGIVVSRKIGNAVVRNRVRRRIREILRREQRIFNYGIIVVLLTGPKITELRYGELRGLVIAKLKEAFADDDI